LRARLGHFRRLNDLLRVRGIGWKSLKKLKASLLLKRPTVVSPSKDNTAQALSNKNSTSSGKTPKLPRASKKSRGPSLQSPEKSRLPED
ncbi:MAG: hypothetical protein MK135_05150, partial [Polyangiaceae bacterium]|nr:hypothetical protein [Polyangiaceae bacterium]